MHISCKSVLLSCLMALFVSGCAHRKDDQIELLYSLYPANQEAGAMGFVRGNGIALRTGESTFDMVLPSGETISGESAIVDASLLSFDGVYAQAMEIDEPTSLSPSVYEFLSRRLQPYENAVTVFTSGSGSNGSQVHCEGFWQNNELKGLGGCSLSDGSLFKYYVKGNYIRR